MKQLPAVLMGLMPVLFGVVWALWSACIRLNYPSQFGTEHAMASFMLALVTVAAMGGLVAFANEKKP